MPGQRREGWRVATYTAPAALVAAAREKAEREDTNLSAVIRAALTRYVEDE